MKTSQTFIKLQVLLCLFFAMSCDNPPSARRTEMVANNSEQSQFYSSGSTYYSSGNTNTNTDSSSDTIAVPSSAVHCQWSLDGSIGFQYSKAHVGAYNICQNQSDDKVIYIQFKEIPVAKVCFYPLHHEGGNSTYIGSAKCLTPTSNSIYELTFSKDRSGFTSLDIDATMMMIESTHYYSYPYGGTYQINGVYVNTGGPLYPTQAYELCNYFLQSGYSNFCTTFKNAGTYTLHSF